jgi:uncharacterized GH25 family protein
MKNKVLLLLASVCILGAGTANAHEILLVPSVVDGKLGVAIESTHRFVAPEELEDAANLSAMVVTSEGTETLSITQSGELSLGAEGAAQTGSAYFVAHRLPLVYSNTPDGFKPGTRVENPDAIFTNR